MKHQLFSESSTHDTTVADVAVNGWSHCSKSREFNQGFVKFDLGVVHPPDAESFHVKSQFPRLKPKFEREFVENRDMEKLTANLLAWVNSQFVTIGKEAYFQELASLTILFSIYVNPFSELYSKDMEKRYCIDEIDERYSEETFKEWRKTVAFFDGIAEVVALIHGVTLKDDILRSSSFQRISSGFVNDLLGMKKEFANGQKDNLIVFLVQEKKMPLDKAVERVCKLMETELFDYTLLKDVILKEFDQDENLVRYLDIIDSVIDGHHSIYAHSTRHRSVGSILLTR